MDKLTADSLNALLAATYLSMPLAWTAWPERAGWMQAPAGTAAYEVGKLLVNADHGLTYMVDEQGPLGARTYTLLVGPRKPVGGLLDLDNVP